MYLGLQQKLFYFITDRDTRYQYLVDNRDPISPKKHLYYPDEYETMSARSIQKYRNRSVYKMLWWALTNQDKITINDKNVINSVIINSVIMIGVCAFGMKSLRKFLFRSQLPVAQIKLERMGFNIRILKALFSIGVFGTIMYKFIVNELKQTYLIDLAFEYKYHFTEKMHSKADTLYEQLWEERLKSISSKTDLIV